MKEDSVVSWLDSAKIKILLVPLSDFPDKKFTKYLEKLNAARQVNLNELPAQDSNDVIIKKLGASGSIYYNFITSIDSNSNDFIDFQLHQRIFGIFGVIHGPSNLKSHEEIDGIMKGLKEKFPYEIPSEILIFEPNESIEQEMFKRITDEGSLKQEIQEFTTRIVSNLSELFNDINQRPEIPSPCGIEDYSGTASRSSSSKAKMRLSGRIQKLLADLHLLTGSFSEAVACYVSASEDARIANDSIWSAAAQEGFNSALCLQNEQLLTDDKTDIYKVLIDKLTPLAVMYERSGIPILSIELLITCSRIHRFIKQGTAALTVLSEAWKSCNLLAFDDKIVAYNRVLKEFAAAGNWRKWALYMVQMAQMLKLAQKPEIALMTLSKTLSVYNLTQSKEYQMIKGWPNVQSALLKEMIKLSESNSNRLLYFLYGWMYLVHSNRCQDTADQVQIIENLRKKSMRDMFSLNSHGKSNSEFVCSLPIFVKLSIEKGNIGGLFVSGKDHSTTCKAGPFIYNPNKSKLNNSTVYSNSGLESDDNLISGEPATFKLILSNPFVFPIVLKNIYLITDDPCDDSKLSEQVSITLPPMTKDQVVLINLVPKQAGQLKILGFCATFMNVEIQFLINSQGKVLEEAQFRNDLGIQFDVIEPQPFLKCSSDTLKKGLQLYEGETIETSLKFTNINTTSCKISMINFKISEDQKSLNDPEFEINEIIFENDQQTTFKIDSDSFDKLLPVDSEEFTVPLKIYGTHNGSIKTATLELFYSSSTESDKIYWRKLTFPLLVTICSIIKIDQFSFHPFSGTSKTFKDSNVLSKFKDLTNANPNDLCVGSFIVYNLESCFSLKIQIEICNIPFVFDEIISNQSAKRIFFIIPRLPKTLEMKSQKKLPLNEKKIASVRKLRRPTGTDDFLDDTFEDFLYDHDQFWIKNYLIDNLRVKWEIYDDQRRQGIVSFSQCNVPSMYHDTIFKEHFTVTVNCDEFKNVSVGQEICVKFSICPEVGEHDFKLKLFPIVVLTDKEVALNFDRVLKFTGCLDSFVRNASVLKPQMRTFKFYPISTATVKIIYQVIELETGIIHWCKNPIVIETTRFE